jgi:hypothetical protein
MVFLLLCTSTSSPRSIDGRILGFCEMYMRVGLLEEVEELWGAAARCVVTF